MWSAGTQPLLAVAEAGPTEISIHYCYGLTDQTVTARLNNPDHPRPTCTQGPSQRLMLNISKLLIRLDCFHAKSRTGPARATVRGHYCDTTLLSLRQALVLPADCHHSSILNRHNPSFAEGDLPLLLSLPGQLDHQPWLQHELLPKTAFNDRS